VLGPPDPRIERLSALVTEHYVFPDVGRQVVAVLAEQVARGAYAGLDDEAFAAAVTVDLQSPNADLHLRLQHSRDELMEGEGELFDEEVYRSEMELDGFGIARVERLPGNVGLLDLRLLHSARWGGHAAVAAMNLVAHTDVLLIDLRRCRGGDPAMVALLCSYLFDDAVHLNDLYHRADDSTAQFWTLPYVPGSRFGGIKPLYVLTSSTTFSGAEELTYNLQQRGRATVVGEITRGGAHPVQAYRIDAHLRATVPIARAINPVSGTNWEGSGVTPDVEVPADRAFEEAYRVALEHVLALGPAGVRRAVHDEAEEALGPARGAPPEATAPVAAAATT
jgi:C-terminal processing protease CtpA/Prc